MPKKAMESLTESMYYVLMAFRLGPMCGMDVMEFVEQWTEGRKRTYRITDKGLEAYHAEQVRLRQCLTDAQRLENEEGSVCLNRKPEPSIDFRPVKAGT